LDKTLLKGVQLLEHLVRAGAPCGVTELAQRTGLHPSNVHRTLQTWVHLGFVAQERGSGAYHCTLRLFEWGCRVADGFDVRRLAHEPLVRLARETQETIHLSVLDGAEIVYLDKIDSPQPVRAYSEVGGRAPAHCVATGKALLAQAGPLALELLPRPLPQATPHTVRDLDALRAQLRLARERGHAVNQEEWRLGVIGLGAPVFDAHGHAVAAVGLSAPAARMGAGRIEALAVQVMATARAIGTALGGGRPRAAA
jgi:IclR family KDG regulon transcriptional repressor